MNESKVTAAVWGPLDEYIVTGHENGVMTKWCTKVSRARNIFYLVGLDFAISSHVIVLSFLNRVI